MGQRGSRRVVVLGLSCAFAGAVVAGCEVGPTYERPNVETPGSISESASITSAMRISRETPWDRWWEVFHEPKLDALVEQARVQNRDLRAAIARVRAAR